MSPNAFLTCLIDSTFIDAGCEEDVSIEEPDPDGRGDGDEVKCVVLTGDKELGLVQAALQEAEYECSGVLVHVPLTTVEVNDEEQFVEVHFVGWNKRFDERVEFDEARFAKSGTRRTITAGQRGNIKRPRTTP